MRVDRSHLSRRPRHAGLVRAVVRLASTAALLTGLMSPRTARAFQHVVLPGETLAQIAARVYGDPKLEAVLVGANALDAEGGSAIVPGMRIEIPAPGHHRVVGHETWLELSLAYLGDTRRAGTIAGANHALAWIPPDPGQEVIVPCVLSHIAAEGDTDVGLAHRYLGDPNKAWVVDAYNFRKPGPLRRGEVVLVALPELTLTERGKAEARDQSDRDRAEGLGQVHAQQQTADAELGPLAREVRGGAYVDAVARGNRVLSMGELTHPQLAAVHHALLEAYVALDATDLARGACAAWKQNEPSVVLDPVQVSPKIRAACTPAGVTAPSPAREPSAPGVPAPPSSASPRARAGEP